MNFDEFIGQVQSRARLPSSGEAVRAVRATLETLARRLQRGVAKDLAAQLPREIGHYLLQEPPEESERLPLEEFFQKVSEREEVEVPLAVYHSRVVVEVLCEAVSSGKIEQVLSQLPPEFDTLFAGGHQGTLGHHQ
jgi:uncharacterized protein (DUF2267 family)